LPPSRQWASSIVMLTTTMHGRDLACMQELPSAGLVSKPLTEAKVNLSLQLHFYRWPQLSQGCYYRLPKLRNDEGHF
jgi:hypothetical protein